MIRGITNDILKRVYDFSDMTNEELRCKFFQKLQECIDLCNNTADIMDWVEKEGIEIEVHKLLSLWLEDGTLNDLINIDLLNNLKTELETKINEKVDSETYQSELNNINSQLIAQENKLSELINSSVNYDTKSGVMVELDNSTKTGAKVISYIKNSIKSLELANSYSHNWFNNNVTGISLVNNKVSFNYSGTWSKNIIKITLPDEIIGKNVTFSFKANYSISTGSTTHVILGTTDYETVNNDFASCVSNENSFATYYNAHSGNATFIAKTNTLLISICPTGEATGAGTVELFDISVNEGVNALNYVPYEGYNIYSLNPILGIGEVIHKYENNHRYIFKGIEYNKGKEYCLFIPQSFKNLRVTLNSTETENVAKTIKNWGKFSAGFIYFTPPSTGKYYLDIWSNSADSEEITFTQVYLSVEYDERFVNYKSNNIVDLKSYDGKTVVVNKYNAPMTIQYFKKGLTLISDSSTFNIVTPEMFGAVGNGVIDDTKAINECFKNGNIIIMKNKYLVSKTEDVNIALKNQTIPISIRVPSNRKIFITGEIICNDKCNVFYVNGDNVEINGGTFVHGEISTAGNYQMGSIALNECTNINVQNVTSNNAIVTAFLCKYISTNNCISERTGSNTMNSAIGYHATQQSEMKNNTVLGCHNDGDLICFGNCIHVTIDGNKLFSASDYWTDTGSQGICLDTASFKCKVINNYAKGYYNPIDVKTWANGNIISNNVLYANKQGITIRRGEMNNLNNTDIISNNLIDLGNGNGSTSPVIGSESVGDYKTCGIYLEGVSNVLVTNNVIYSTINTDKAIFIMVNEVNENNSIKIVGNTFNNSYIEYQDNGRPVLYTKGVYIMANNSAIKNAELIIKNNLFKIDTINNEDIQILNLRYIKNVIISDNEIFGNKNISNISNCTNVYMSNNTGEVNNCLANISNTNVLMLTGNTIQNKNTTIEHLLTLTSVTKSVSNNNTIVTVNETLLDTGCANKNDLIVR